MARYQKLLYNDDCILDTKYNAVFYKGDIGWNRYEIWKDKYPEEENDIVKEKEALLRWNQGEPTIVDGTKYQYHKNGNLYKTETDNIHCEYNGDGILIRKEVIDLKSTFEYVPVHNKSVLVRKETPKDIVLYDSNSEQIIYKEYKHNGFLIKENFSDERIYKHSYSKNGITVEKEIVNGITIKKKTYIRKKLEKVVDYYTGANRIYKKRYKNSYSEYYPNNVIRATGLLTNNNNPTGCWKFYHLNGELESEHWFNDGRFESKSRSSVFYENGILNFNIKHG